MTMRTAANRPTTTPATLRTAARALPDRITCEPPEAVESPLREAGGWEELTFIGEALDRNSNHTAAAAEVRGRSARPAGAACPLSRRWKPGRPAHPAP